MTVEAREPRKVEAGDLVVAEDRDRRAPVFGLVRGVGPRLRLIPLEDPPCDRLKGRAAFRWIRFSGLSNLAEVRRVDTASADLQIGCSGVFVVSGRLIITSGSSSVWLGRRLTEQVVERALQFEDARHGLCDPPRSMRLRSRCGHRRLFVVEGSRTAVAVDGRDVSVRHVRVVARAIGWDV